MLLLLEYYIKYRKYGLVAPQNVLTWTNTYKEDNDKYLTFLNTCTEESETHIFSSTLYNTFKIWCRENYPDEKIVNNKEFLKGIKPHKEYLHDLIDDLINYLDDESNASDDVSNSSDTESNASDDDSNY